MSETPELPPPSFDVLVHVLLTPCYVHLGLVENPATGRKQVSLDEARWAIDLLHVLRERTDASLSAEERSYFDNAMHQVRDVFVRARG